MRLPLLVLASLSFASSANAGGPLCYDVCTASVAGTPTCDSMNLGCNPNAATPFCGECLHNGWCRPGGTCDTTVTPPVCVGVVCTPDAGTGAPDAAAPDAASGIDATTTDTGTTTPPDDGGTMTDGGTVNDATASDSGIVVDGGPDAGKSGGGGFVGRADDKEEFDEGCGCTLTDNDRETTVLSFLCFLLLLGLRRQM